MPKQKRLLAAEITESIVKNTGTDPNYISVIFEDVEPSDWSGAGKISVRRARKRRLFQSQGSSSFRAALSLWSPCHHGPAPCGA